MGIRRHGCRSLQDAVAASALRVVEPDEPCPCHSGKPWAECCARQLPLTLRYVPVRLLSPDDPVAAGCGRGGHCCREVHVPLTPFDLLRLARRLSMTTGELLAGLTTVTAEGGVEIEGSPSCPLLCDNVCSIYEDRPDSCRMYPFWRVVTGDQEWLVERHTCSGCWQECRSVRQPAREALAGAGVRIGQEAERRYQAAIRDLDEAGVFEDQIEEFMASIYDADSDPHQEQRSDDLFEEFTERLERTRIRFLSTAARQLHRTGGE